MGKLTKDRRDLYYRRAKQEGYRARSAYKLLQLDDTFRFFDGVTRIVDLCAAPGSWSQVCQRRVWLPATEEERNDVVVVAADLQDMAPIEGVNFVRGDITADAVQSQILSHMHARKVQLVLCDGAPDVTGMHDFDEFVQSYLLFAALSVASRLLEPGGIFVSKLFRGENTAAIFGQLRRFFKDVRCCKPASSRNSSLEAFVVARGFEGEPVSSEALTMNMCSWSESTYTRVPYHSCGDLAEGDADRTYALEEGHTYVDPIHPPLTAPYLEALREKRNTTH